MSVRGGGHLEAGGEVPDPSAVAVCVGDHHHFVAKLEETLRQLVDVALHPAHVGVEEVGHHAATGTQSHSRPHTRLHISIKKYSH